MHIHVDVFLHVIKQEQQQTFTSSTTQGAGGSLRNRKPIGEVSCRDSWMAERTDGLKGG
jgi:hypothetical protein